IGARTRLVASGTPLDPLTMEFLIDAIDLARELFAGPGTNAVVDFEAVTTALALAKLLRRGADAAAAAELTARVRASLTDLAVMREAAARLAAEDHPDDGWTATLGPDPFHRRKPSPRPSFIQLDYRELRPDQVLPFFAAIDLTKPAPEQPLTAANVPRLEFH